MGIEAEEIRVSRDAWAYFMREAQKVLAEGEEEDEQ